MTEVSRMKKKQSANRNVVKGLITKANDAMERGRSSATVGEAAACLRTIQSKEKLLTEINDEICGLVAEEEIEGAIEEAVSFEMSISADVERIKEFVVPATNEQEDVKPKIATTNTGTEVSKGNAKLGVR